MICHVGKLKKKDIPEIGEVDEDSRDDQKTKVKWLESWKTSERKGGIYTVSESALNQAPPAKNK